MKGARNDHRETAGHGARKSAVAQQLTRRLGFLRILALAGVLTALSLSVFLQTREFDLVSYDDPAVISGNPMVRQGLTRDGAAWAFTTNYFSHYWQPLTWLSHQLDVTLFGFNPGRFHLVNVGLHLANTLLLFLTFVIFSGRALPSALTAALFGIHPLHVESVAWVTERRDVLSSFFFMLSLLSYRWYLGKPRIIRYLPLLCFAVCGVMAKPMVLTLPLFLLLFDFWPAGRLFAKVAGPGAARGAGISWQRLLGEKIPLIVISLGTAAAAYAMNVAWAKQSYPLGIRLENALLSYGKYLQKTLWPADLAYFYPHPGFSLSWHEAAPGALLLAAATVGVTLAARARPALLVGWLWFLVGLLPVIGLVAVGNQGYADHFTYLPLIGIFFGVSWGFPEACAAPRSARALLLLLVVGIMAALAAVSWMQTGYWRNTLLLTSHAVEVTRGNWVAHNDYGRVLLAEGRLRDASLQFDEALRVRPGDSQASYNALLVSGMILEGQGRQEEALAAYRRLRSLFPSDAEVLRRFGYLASKTANAGEAAGAYEQLLRLSPDDPGLHYNLGVNLAQAGRLNEAIDQYHAAIRLKPDYFQAHANLAAAHFTEGRLDEAGVEYREALHLKPGDVITACGLGQVLVRQGRPAEAAAVYRKALESAPADPRLSGLLEQALLASPAAR